VYRKLILALREHFRCVALDYPGFGLSLAAPGYDHSPTSHARVVAALVQQLELYNTTLVTHDWGGPIGLLAAAYHPQRMRGLVLTNLRAWPMPLRATRWLGQLAHSSPGRWLAHRLNLYGALSLPLAYYHVSLGAEEWAHYDLPLATPAGRESARLLTSALADRQVWLAVAAAARSLTQLPVLAVWGAHDLAAAPQLHAQVAQLFAHSETLVLPKAGHMVPEEAPAALAAATRRWWNAEVKPPVGKPNLRMVSL
jgi:haloalkane dehalogenase